MTKIIMNEENKENLNEIMTFNDFYNSIGKTFYFKIGNYYYSLHQYAPDYNGDLNYCLIDLTNAGKAGKDCAEYRISGNIKDFKQVFECNFDDVFYEIATNSIDGLKVNKWIGKGVNFFNPMTIKENYKPLKEEPKKWTVKHALRAIVNHQYENLKCDGYYTDDYAYDNAVNFGIKEIKNTMLFLKKVIENKSGWHVYTYDNKVCLNCYSFDTNSFTFKLA